MLPASVVLLTAAVFICVGVGAANDMPDQGCLSSLLVTALRVDIFVPRWTKKEVTELCTKYDEFKACWDQNQANASENEQVFYETTAPFYKRLCEEQSTEYMKHRACLANSLILDGCKQCYETYNQQLASRSRKTKSDICRLLGILIACIGQTVEVRCGTGAAKWVTELDGGFLRLRYQQHHCPGFRRLATASTCPWDKCNECLRPLLTAMRGTTLPDVPRWPRAMTKEICEAYDDFASCWSPFISKCNDRERMLSASIQHYYGYLCKNNLLDYMAHQSCFLRLSTNQEVNLCDSRYVHEQMGTRNVSVTPRQKEKRWYCRRLMGNYLDCIETAVSRECGSEAAEWARGMAAAPLRPMDDYLGCGLASSTKEFTETNAVTSISLRSPVIFTSTVSPRDKGCDLQAIDNCAYWLHEAEHSYPAWPFPVPSWPAHIAEKLCSRFVQFQSCWASLETKCTAMEQVRIVSMANFYRYVCKDNLRVYLRHRQCLGESHTQQKLVKCAVLTKKPLQWPNTTELITKLCDEQQAQVDCIEKAVKMECGEQTVEWAKGLRIVSLRPYADIIGCRLEGSTASYGAELTNYLLFYCCIALVHLAAVLAF